MLKSVEIRFVGYESDIECLSQEFIEFLQNKYIFKYDTKTTVYDFFIFLYDQKDNANSASEIEFIGSERYKIYDGKSYLQLNLDANFENVLKYLNIKDEVMISYTIGIAGGGEVEHNEADKIGLKLSFNSDENIHAGRPHIHVEDCKSGKKASIDLLTYKIIIGEMDKRKYKKLLRLLGANRSKYIEYWNKYTNGIKIEI